MRVLVAVNEPEFAKSICDFVTSTNWNDGTEFTVITVVEPLKIGSISAVLPGPILDEMRSKNEEQSVNVLTKTVHEIAEAFPSTTVTQQVMEGMAAEQILQFAESWKADLIIIGSHNRQAISRVFLGSVSLAVASKSCCSVLIVKASTAQS